MKHLGKNSKLNWLGDSLLFSVLLERDVSLLVCLPNKIHINSAVETWTESYVRDCRTPVCNEL